VAADDKRYKGLETLELLLLLHKEAEDLVSGIQERMEAGDAACLLELAVAIHTRRKYLEAIRGKTGLTGVVRLEPAEELANLLGVRGGLVVTDAPSISPLNDETR